MLLAGNMLKRNKITLCQFYLNLRMLILADLKQLEVEMRDADPQQRKTGAKFFTTADCHLLSPAARKTYDAISKSGKFIGAPLLMTLQYP